MPTSCFLRKAGGSQKISSSYESKNLSPEASEWNVNFPAHNDSFYRLAPIMIAMPTHCRYTIITRKRSKEQAWDACMYHLTKRVGASIHTNISRHIDIITGLSLKALNEIKTKKDLLRVRLVIHWIIWIIDGNEERNRNLHNRLII